MNVTESRDKDRGKHRVAAVGAGKIVRNMRDPAGAYG